MLLQELPAPPRPRPSNSVTFPLLLSLLVVNQAQLHTRTGAQLLAATLPATLPLCQQGVLEGAGRLPLTWLFLGVTFNRITESEIPRPGSAQGVPMTCCCNRTQGHSLRQGASLMHHFLEALAPALVGELPGPPPGPPFRDSAPTCREGVPGCPGCAAQDAGCWDTPVYPVYHPPAPGKYQLPTLRGPGVLAPWLLAAQTSWNWSTCPPRTGGPRGNDLVLQLALSLLGRRQLGQSCPREHSENPAPRQGSLGIGMEKLKLSLLRENRRLQCWEQGPGSVRRKGGRRRDCSGWVPESLRTHGFLLRTLQVPPA